MSRIEVECSPVDSGWVATVNVSDHGSSREYEVVISQAELSLYDTNAVEPSELVRRSFEFLLAREPKESILPSFGLSTIGRYYPEYDREIRQGP